MVFFTLLLTYIRGGHRYKSIWVIPWVTFALFIALQVIGNYSNIPWHTYMIQNTLSYFSIFSAYFGIVFLIAYMDRDNALLVVVALVFSAVFQSLYGTITFIGGQETILGIWTKEHYKGDITGTFVNRNHFAGYLTLLWGLGLSYFFSSQDRFKDIRLALSIGLAMIFSTLLLIAVMGSHSRLGMISALVAFLLWLFLLGRKQNSESSWLTPVMIGLPVLATLSGIWFGIGRLIHRFAQLDQNNRFLVWQSMVDQPLNTWVFGIGAGSFEDYFRTISPTVLVGEGVWREAHSDWLEFVFDFGLVGASLILVSFVYWFFKVKPLRWSLLQYGAFCGVVAIGVHSLGDFNLQIPGVAVTFWVLVGLLMNHNISLDAQPKRKRIRRKRSARTVSG